MRGRLPSPPPGRALLTLVAFFLALAWSPAASAQAWYESYDEAEKALQAESWSEAVRHLNAALEEQPTSGANLRTYGMRFIPYFPYLKLGIAYYHLGQTDAALQAFETEERLGAVANSETASALLRSYRERIRRDGTAREEQQQSRAEQMVLQNVALAQRLEKEGRFEDALAAVGKVLAVAPEEAEAQALQQRLRVSLAEQQRRRQADERRAELLRRGRGELSAGAYSQAAATFREALELRQDEDARSLLQEAQAGLRAELETRQSRDGRERQIQESLDRASQLERSGDLASALAELQVTLTLDPQSSGARQLQDRLLRAQSAAAEAGIQEDALTQDIREAEGALAQGNYEQALRATNRALALDPANTAALGLLAQAYALLSDSLFSSDAAPPSILLDEELLAGISDPGTGTDTDTGAGTGSVTNSRDLLLSGTVYDSTPVEMEFRSAATGELLGEGELQARSFQGVWITDFKWSHRLPVGVTGIDIVAIDGEGNTSSLRYQTKYVVPFLRSVWFPASLGLALALAVGGTLLVRSRRRQRLLHDRFNPYIAGAPILEQARFFGRQQLLDYVLRRIANNSIMLYGERRIGKTSFQHQLKQHLTRLEDPVHEFYPVYIDLQGIPQERFFATLAAEVFHELSPKLGGMEPALPPAGGAYGYRDFVKDIQRVLKALKERTSKKVKLVLLIDEVDELNDYDPRINQRLRSLFMRAFADNLVSVVSGVGIKKHWEREGSPWYNFFQEIEVRPLDPAEARALIEAPVRGIFTFEDGVAEQIIQSTHAKPYLIQRLCSGLVDRMHEEHRRIVTTADVEAACRIEGL